MPRLTTRSFALGPLVLAALGPFARAAAPSTSTAPSDAPRPNIVVIYADDLGASDLSLTGSTYYETPAIDRLASEGMFFTQAYSCGPNCAPSRASIISGMLPPRHGIYTVDDPARGPTAQRRLVPVENNTVLAPSFRTIAEVLRDAGYATAMMGKWHLGDGPASPENQGFDLNLAGSHAGLPSSYFSPYRLKAITDGPKGEYLTTRLTHEAVAYLDRQAALRLTSDTSSKPAPFFLYFAHYTVHTPLQAPKDLVDKYRPKPASNGQDDPTYAAMIETLDNSVRDILAKLDATGLSANTLVVFASDNGGVQGVTENRPYRGFKGMLYEGGIRTPLIARWPGHIPAGVRVEAPVIQADLYPTFAALAGAKLDDPRLDGRDLSGVLLRRAPAPERPLFWHFPAYLQGKDETNKDRYFRTRPVSAIREGYWKLLHFYEDGRNELYNLAKDVSETKNLASADPERTAALSARLNAWLKKTNAFIPTEKNPAYAPK